MLSVFLRDGNDVYRTYSTTSRGVDRLVFRRNILDWCLYGRQEDRENSPSGWPQHPTYGEGSSHHSPEVPVGETSRVGAGPSS
jgi:predicted dithiol-disulfide oxidoreductase (DUF899 family)